MRWPREAAAVDRHGFRIRGSEASRIEGFSDAVFGFAVTLLVVSLQVPLTFDDLVGVLRGLPAFAVSFALLAGLVYFATGLVEWIHGAAVGRWLARHRTCLCAVDEGGAGLRRFRPMPNLSCVPDRTGRRNRAGRARGIPSRRGGA